MPEVSVIIPTYNCSRYIAEAVESVLSQTCRQMEIIIVDDGSTDETKEVLRPFMIRKHITYIHQQNQGPGAARNAGILASRGDYIAFLDSDDSLTPDSIERRLRLIMKNQQVGLVFSDYYFEPNEGHANAILRKAFFRRYSKISEARDDGFIFVGDGITRKYGPAFFIFTGTVLVRKTVFDRVGLFTTDTSIGSVEDRDMWLRIASEYHLGYVDAPLAYYKNFRSNLTGRDPIRWARHRLNFLDSVVREDAGDGQVSRFIRRRRASVYYDLAVHYRKKNLLHWILTVAKAMYYDPWNARGFRLLASCMIPARFRVKLRWLITSIIGGGIRRSSGATTGRRKPE